MIPDYLILLPEWVRIRNGLEGDDIMGTGTKIVAAAIAIVLVFLLFPDGLGAQRRGRTKIDQAPWTGPPQPPQRSGPLAFDNKPFNIAAKQLPPFYAGYEPEALYEKIRKEEDSRDLIYALRVIPAGRLYDPAMRVMSVYCRLSPVFEKGKEDQALKGFSVKYQPLVDNTYTRTDASGAKIEIEEIKFREFVLAFPNFINFPVEKPPGKPAGKDAQADGQEEGWDAIRGAIPLTPDEAKQVGDKVRTLLVLGPTPPFVSSDTLEEHSTAGKFREYSARYHYIHSRILELWFYDFETGRVLMKLKPAKDASGRE